MDISELRSEYAKGGLNRDDLSGTPFGLFELWFHQATGAQIKDANAMHLATVSAMGRPTLRTVLLKAFDEQGFVFYTNYTSQKAREIEENPQVSALLFWKELERQVEISGKAEKITPAGSRQYFLSRPRGSQLGAWASAQSSIVSSRQCLEQQLAEIQSKFGEGDIPPPDFWGGYRIVPDTVEFWQGGKNRLHDRFEYRLATDKTWDIVRLSP